MSRVLALVEHGGGTIDEISLQTLTAARRLAADLGVPLEAVTVGAGPGVPAVGAVHALRHALLDDYAPEAWGAALAQLVEATSPAAVAAPGTERGNEVLAHTAARLDLPLVANCTEITPGDPWELTRVRWGGSLLEVATLDAPVALLTVASHTFAAAAADGAPGPAGEFTPDLDPVLARTKVVERAGAQAGVTLTTAPVVVGGGRGVGSAEGFAVLEELAALIGGAVGCSRVATNNGWRPHSDQVGQTGTRIAPELYIACGISGAIQHWVGCMASKKILAINTDPEAPMVTKADYAVIGDLHEVLGAVVAELRGREA